MVSKSCPLKSEIKDVPLSQRCPPPPWLQNVVSRSVLSDTHTCTYHIICISCDIRYVLSMSWSVCNEVLTDRTAAYMSEIVKAFYDVFRKANKVYLLCKRHAYNSLHEHVHVAECIHRTGIVCTRIMMVSTPPCDPFRFLCIFHYHKSF